MEVLSVKNDKQMMEYVLRKFKEYKIDFFCENVKEPLRKKETRLMLPHLKGGKWEDFSTFFKRVKVLDDHPSYHLRLGYFCKDGRNIGEIMEERKEKREEKEEVREIKEEVGDLNLFYKRVKDWEEKRQKDWEEKRQIEEVKRQKEWEEKRMRDEKKRLKEWENREKEFQKMREDIQIFREELKKRDEKKEIVKKMAREVFEHVQKFVLAVEEL